MKVGNPLSSLSLDLVVRIVELVSTFGLIATCFLLYRFFRGGIMGAPFALFGVASVFLSLGVFIATLIESQGLPNYPFNAIHLLLEITFVLLLLGGLVLFYRRWIGEHKDPNYR
jgi:hypothetical protein